jgi:maltoporin
VCNICKKNNLQDNTTCQTCGYSSGTKKIDPDLCKNHYQKLKKERRNWVKAVEFLGRIEEFTRYSKTDIGKLTGIAKSTVTQDLQLAKGLKDRPELKIITSKKTAFDTLNGVDSNIIVFRSRTNFSK